MLRPKIILLSGLLLMLALYFWGHNIGEQPAILMWGFTTLVTITLDILIVSLIVLTSGGIGRWLRFKVARDDVPLATAIPLESGLGLGAISLGTLLFGLVGLFNLALWAVLLIGAVLLRTWIMGWLRAVRVAMAAVLRPQTGWERFVLIVSVALLALALLLALAPPTAWDALTYHLVGPHRYVLAGQITTQADNHFLGFPQGMEMLFGLALALFDRDVTAAPLHLYVGVLALLAVAGLVRQYADRSTAYTSVLLAFSSYSLWRLFSLPYVDLAVMLYAALALVAVQRWRETDRAAWLALVGVFAGLALSVKYTAGLYIIALGVFVLVRQPRGVIRNDLIMGGAALLVFAPWLLKGALLYQNPIYPYLLDGVSWDSLRMANFNVASGGLLSGENAWQWLVLPFSATIFGTEGVSPYSFTLGPWLLTLPLMLLLGWRYLPEKARPLAQDCGLLAVVMLALWLLLAGFSGIGAQPRLFLFAFPAVIVLGTLALNSLARWPKRPLNVDFIVRAALGFTILLNFFNVVHDVARKDLATYYVDQDVDRYLRTNLGNYYAAVRRLEQLPAASTVRFMWEPKSYYCPTTITCIPDILFDHWSWPLRWGLTEAEIWQQWRDEGVDYLLVYGLERDFGYGFWLDQHDFARAENERFPAALAEHMEPVWTDGFAYTLYTWRAES
jgi:4-amino-4-deoxy-L-arabinose transferase-like glycosyltransferase